jgi:hypothetical protein
MQEATKKRWIEVCAEVAVCEDPHRLEELRDVITQIIDEEEVRLEGSPQRERSELALGDPSLAALQHRQYLTREFLISTHPSRFSITKIRITPLGSAH